MVKITSQQFGLVCEPAVFSAVSLAAGTIQPHKGKLPGSKYRGAAHIPSLRQECFSFYLSPSLLGAFCAVAKTAHCLRNVRLSACNSADATGRIFGILYMGICKENSKLLVNPLKTTRNLLYIRNHSVPRCKHFPPRL